MRRPPHRCTPSADRGRRGPDLFDRPQVGTVPIVALEAGDLEELSRTVVGGEEARRSGARRSGWPRQARSRYEARSSGATRPRASSKMANGLGVVVGPFMVGISWGSTEIYALSGPGSRHEAAGFSRPASPSIAWSSQARAYAQYRSAVRRLTPRTSAASSWLSPATVSRSSPTSLSAQAVPSGETTQCLVEGQEVEAVGLVRHLRLVQAEEPGASPRPRLQSGPFSRAAIDEDRPHRLGRRGGKVRARPSQLRSRAPPTRLR